MPHCCSFSYDSCSPIMHWNDHHRHACESMLSCRQKHPPSGLATSTMTASLRPTTASKPISKLSQTAGSPPGMETMRDAALRAGPGKQSPLADGNPGASAAGHTGDSVPMQRGAQHTRSLGFGFGHGEAARPAPSSVALQAPQMSSQAGFWGTPSTSQASVSGVGAPQPGQFQPSKIGAAPSIAPPITPFGQVDPLIPCLKGLSMTALCHEAVFHRASALSAARVRQPCCVVQEMSGSAFGNQAQLSQPAFSSPWGTPGTGTAGACLRPHFQTGFEHLCSRWYHAHTAIMHMMTKSDRFNNLKTLLIEPFFLQHLTPNQPAQQEMLLSETVCSHCLHPHWSTTVLEAISSRQRVQSSSHH